MKKLIFYSLFLSLPMIGSAQTFHQFSVSFNSEAIGLPFTNYSPIHPGVEVTGTLKKNEQPKNIQCLNVKAGMFHHQKLETAIYLGGEYQYSKKLFNQRLSIDLPVGLGYLHTFYPGELYEQNENGDFEVVNQSGRSHLYVNLGVGLTYLSDGKVQPFVRQELFLETPFANGIPAIPHSLIKLGVQVKL